ncbi:MAG: pantothenate kinase [Scytolyngbya sp. HA4215-MV1]|nr:pantothenate kinase [Scytolyngbya sp. HA4215-MV1]
MPSLLSHSNHWLALVIGNSRLHWAWFIDATLQYAWDTSYLSPAIVQQLLASGLNFAASAEMGLPWIKAMPDLPAFPIGNLWLASVVPAQTELWQSSYPTQVITLEQIPLRHTYATLGIDRALAVWGAIVTWGSPVLVMDAGTAFTFTGADANHNLVGGAILPGMGLQFQALGQATAALPLLDSQTLQKFPNRWATNTSEAIASGIIHTLLAGIQSFVEDWWHQFPNSPVVLTGGDSRGVMDALKTQKPSMAARIMRDPDLIFWGVRSLRNLATQNDSQLRF